MFSVIVLLNYLEIVQLQYESVTISAMFQDPKTTEAYIRFMLSDERD